MAAGGKTPAAPVFSGAAPERIGSLAELRDAVAAVDAALLDLLNRRAALSVRAGKLKRAAGDAAVFRPGREIAQLRGLDALNDGPLPEEHLHAIYREILSSSRALQAPQRVAVAGPEHGPVRAAARKALGAQAVFVPAADAAAVFEAVASADCSVGVLVPDTGEGPVAGLFFRTGLSLLAAAPAPLRLFFIGRAGEEERADCAEDARAVLFVPEDDSSGADAVRDVFAARGFTLCGCSYSGAGDCSGRFAGGGSRRLFLAEFRSAAPVAAGLWASAATEAAALCREFRVLGRYPTLF